MPNQPLIWLGAAILLVAWPQDIFYFVNNDVPNIALFPFCLWRLARFRAGSGRGIVACTLTGLAIGVTAMGKGTCLPLVIAAVPLLGPTAWRAIRGREFATLRRLGVIASWIGLLWFGWQGYSYWATGHIGASHKLSALGIFPKESGWFDHPLFTLDGLQTYFSHLLRYFWRGELRWHGEEMGHAIVDVLWIGTTFAFFAVSCWTSLRRRAIPRLSAPLAWTAWAGSLAGVALLMLISIAHTYGQNQYPSQDFPYFTSGRLLAGLFPLVAALWIDGLRHSIGRFSSRAAWIALGVWVTTLTIAETTLMLPVIANPHNFWHLNG